MANQQHHYPIVEVGERYWEGYGASRIPMRAVVLSCGHVAYFSQYDAPELGTMVFCEACQEKEK